MRYLGLFLLILIICLTGFFYYNSQPLTSIDETKNFVINPGDGADMISTRLYANGFIRNKYVFLIIARWYNQNSKLRAGLFKLSSSMSPSQIIKELTTGGNHDYWLKIIEGQRIEEIVGDFQREQEGYVFPDSYLIPQDYTPANISTLISKNFSQKFEQAKQNATNSNLSDKEIIILASLLEREARSFVSKQNVAGIIMNRLNINMALQLDATVQYAKDSLQKPTNYWRPITKADLSIDSKYNTYLYPGLPPGPICNPGYDSIYAAFHPIESENLFYITGNDNLMHYAKTLDEHNANIHKYLK
jgi:UPF0755 protein